MNAKDYLGLDPKKKKKLTIVPTKQNPPITNRRTTFAPRIEVEKVEKLDKVEKLLKATVRKTKIENIPKSTKNDKSSKIGTSSNVSIKPQIQTHDFESVRPSTTTNLALKQTRDNQRILAEIDAHFTNNDEFDYVRQPKRHSDLCYYPQETSLHKVNSHAFPRRRDEGVNPNSEDNNLPNKADKIKGHFRNPSILQKFPTREVHTATLVQESAKLSDITNLTKKIGGKTSVHSHYENLQSNTSNSNSSYSHLENTIEETHHVEQPRLRSALLKKANHTEGFNSKVKSKIEKHKEDIENIPLENFTHLKIENMVILEDYKDTSAPSRRYADQKIQAPRPIELSERINDIKPSYTSDLRNQKGDVYNGYLPSIPINKNPKSNSSSSGHTPTYSTTGGTQRLNTSNLSTRSTNTQNSANNKSQVALENSEKRSIGRASSNTQAGSNSGQLKNKSGLPRLGNNIPKYSDHKTDSTYVSGGDSTSPILDCEESLSNNIVNMLSVKKENLSWLDKSDFEMRTGDLFGSGDNRKNFHGLVSEKTSTSRQSLTTEEELASFNPENNACAIDSDTINYLIMREMEYAPDPHYFETKQVHITWIMRAILLDWMMEVCMEFTLKRETYHYAVNYVDRYLLAVPNIQKWELQLVGVTAMYLASKVEEIYAPKVADFARSADNGYTCQQIVDMELKMIKNLKWFLNPPSLYTWANWYMCQWDLYIEHSEFAKNHPLVSSCEEGYIQYKQPNEKSYARFREIVQLIDCALLDVQTLQYKPRALIASFMYMTLGKHFKQFTTQQIYEEFPKSSLYLIDQQYAFNDLFGDFLLYSFGFQLVDLLPSIQYASTYFKLPLNFDLPTAAKINKENVLEGHFEEFLAYQTHHPLNIDYIRRRPRNNF